MKTLSLMILLLTLVACGKQTSTSSSSSSKQLSYNGLQLNTATLFIPSNTNMGGSVSLKISGDPKTYNVDFVKSNSQVSLYLSYLSAGQIQVTPKSINSIGKEYNVGYNGSFEQGPCMNPSATCDTVVLTQIVAF